MEAMHLGNAPVVVTATYRFSRHFWPVLCVRIPHAKFLSILVKKNALCTEFALHKFPSAKLILFTLSE